MPSRATIKEKPAEQTIAEMEANRSPTRELSTSRKREVNACELHTDLSEHALTQRVTLGGCFGEIPGLLDCGKRKGTSRTGAGYGLSKIEMEVVVIGH